jgi:[ribosomal protein S5]-alanine N-acetyltransferase
MNWSTTIQTPRFELKPFTLDDADFVLELVNTPNWIRFIGDRNVHSIDDAQAYLKGGILKLWGDKGYGPYVAHDRETGEKMAYVGWVKRDYLDTPDIGYACLPRFYRRGIVHEANTALLDCARKAGEWPHIYAITLPENEASIGVLRKSGFQKLRSFVEEPANEVVDLYQLIL